MKTLNITSPFIALLVLMALLSGCEPEPDPEKKKLKEDLENAQKQNSTLGFYLIVAVVAGSAGILYFFATRTTVTRSPAHEVVANSFVIDAKNLMHGSAQGQVPSILLLIGLLLELHKRKAAYKCFFDANTYYALKEAQRLDHGRAYRTFCRDFPDQFVEVPGGNRADDFILDFAHSHGPVIISNDRYRDFFDKYSWLANGNSRRVSFAVHSGIVQIYPLGIQAAVPNDLEAAITTLRAALNSQKNVSA